MKRVNRIIHHPLFERQLARLDELETTRSFCRHGLQHLLDVARLGWIAALEQRLSLKRDVVYATALLHDMGRVEQIENGTPHHQASASFAGRILSEAGFSEEEVHRIQRAILAHREDGAEDSLGRLLFWADKASRACWNCGMKAECNWSDEKKNWDLTR